MRLQLIESTIESIRAEPTKVKAGHKKLKAHYEAQDAFNGWDNYKKPGGWALCHYDSERIVAADKDSMERRKTVKAIRYALHRWSTEAQRKASGGKPKAFPKAVQKVIAAYEKNLVVIHNGGALGFAVKWDVDPMDPAKVYVRGESMEKQWHDSLEAKELPTKQ